MRRTDLSRVAASVGVILLCIGGITLLAHARGRFDSGATVMPDAARRHASTQITHIVIIIKENHSFDNLFGRLREWMAHGPP